jgi:hypothetical protein
MILNNESNIITPNRMTEQTVDFEGVDIPEKWITENPIYLEYIADMTPIQKTALKIAMSHLKTSFDMERSNGFVEWLSSRSA